MTEDKTWKEIAQIKAEPGESKGPLHRLLEFNEDRREVVDRSQDLSPG